MAHSISQSQIIIVEDPFVGEFVKMLLRRQGYRATTADVIGATERLSSAKDQVQLLITNMPAVFAQFGDRVPVLYLSACPEPEHVKAFRRRRLLTKPFHPQSLLALVRELFDGAEFPS